MLDSKAVSKILQRVALDHPERYAATVKALGDIGRQAAYYQGESMGIEDLRDPVDTKSILAAMDKEIASIKSDDDTERRRKTEDIWLRYASRLEREAMQAAKAKGNAVADSVVSGARGKPLQLRAMLSTPAIFEDSLGRIIPIFARSSYAAGVSPAEMLAGTFGARKSTTATKTATAKGGFWSKMLGQATADMVVTEEDCGTTNGIDLDPSDRSLRHRVLARPAAGLAAGDLVTRKSWALLQNKAKGPVLVRSAITCESKHGVCAKCVGANPEGKLPPVGEHVGATASQSLGEPVTQSSLNCLVRGTLVRMADFSVKPIEAINVGEIVLGANKKAETFPVVVTHVWDQGLQPVQEYVYHRETNDSTESLHLQCTTKHELLCSVEDSLVKLPAGHEGATRAVGAWGAAKALLGSVTPLGVAQCYDITVAHPDELFVLANGLIVSNTKHLSGAATGKKQYAGLDWLARFVQVPDNFPDRAQLAEEEGIVTLEDAPQGGHYVHVGKSKHYVPQSLQLLVKNGQSVERGAQLSEGIVRPDDMVRLRGLGEGRLYYARRLKQMLDEGDTPADIRQAEIVARSTVNHVRLKEADDFHGYLPEDPVRYGDLLDQWQEAKDAADLPVSSASGMYLQKPALHYTIGTQLTPSMTKKLAETGFKSVRVSKQPPPFENEMLRLQTQAYANPDWLASQHTSYLGRQLSDAAMRGQDTNVRRNTHFAPPLAYGVDFGKRLKDLGVF